MDDLKYQVDLLTALNEKLMKSEHIFRQIAESTGNVYLYYDYNDKEIRVDFIGPWDELTGEKITNSPYDESYMLNLLLDEDQDVFREKILCMERDKSTNVSLEVHTKTRKFSFRVEAIATYDSEGRIYDKLVTFSDITKTKARNDELHYMAYYDTLTGLYNRNRFVEILRDYCSKATNERTSVEVLLLDIDDFKKINDTIGLVMGDELVQELSMYLKTYECEDVQIGRFGSDMFVIAIYNPCNQKTADNIYRAIRDKLHNPFVLSNRQNVEFTISAGVAEFPDAGETAAELIKNAELVLYSAKEHGRNQIEFFEPDILSKHIKDISIEKQLKAAANNNDFALYFQPQFSSETGKLRGTEVLLRWPSVNGGFVSMPEEIIPAAEKNGLIVPIGEWVLKESMRIYSEFRSKYHFPMTLSVNVSPVQLLKDNFTEVVQNLLLIYEISPETLELELTESTFINDYDDVILKINILRKMGVKISLDDFGTGYSSLTYFKKLPIDTLKLDRTVIESMLSDEYNGYIIKSILELCDKFGITTIAEGVETKEQLLYLQKVHCNLIQGFLLGKPMPKNEFEKIIIRQLPG